ncbi:MAG: hypothetical protein M3417_12585 [Actinomycetota bacterium]|nr:hypothetical protein [Actinomycetota bacterium]
MIAVAATFAPLVALWVVFGLVLEPNPDAAESGCTTGLYGGLYGDLIAPLHFAAFVIMAAACGWLAARRSPDGRPSGKTVASLTVLGLFAVAALAVHKLMDWPGLIALLGVGPVAVAFTLGALIHSVITVRSGLPADERWRRHAAVAQVGLWLTLTVGLSATLAGSWVNGAGLFCF